MPERSCRDFTHLQTAQPVTFGHHLLAYVEMFGRDRGRFADARARLNELPLGAGALAGVPPSRSTGTPSQKISALTARWRTRSTRCRTGTSRWNS